jgi:hypothetical protein
MPFGVPQTWLGMGGGEDQRMESFRYPKLQSAHEEQTNIGGGTNMTENLAPLTQRAAWKALEAHYKKIRKLHLRRLFAKDPQRGERLTAEAVGIYLDYSKNRITDETVKLLL